MLEPSLSRSLLELVSMPVCRYCKTDKHYPCHNTRDMTDFAIEGDETCFEQLATIGWGESGENYVRLNKADRARRRALSPPV